MNAPIQPCQSLVDRPASAPAPYADVQHEIGRSDAASVARLALTLLLALNPLLAVIPTGGC